MRYLLVTALFILSTSSLKAQSKTTEELHKKYNGAMALFFYNNTLRMLNQSNDKEFDELIKDIEKMKFLMIDKKELGSSDYTSLIKNYKAEAFEEIMTSRHAGKNFDVYLKEKDGKTKGMIVTVNDPDNLFVLDIVGSIALNKVTKFFTTLDQSSEIGKKIKAFTSDGNDEKQDDKHHDDHNGHDDHDKHDGHHNHRL